jgi:hypothetical protein
LRATPRCSATIRPPAPSRWISTDAKRWRRSSRLSRRPPEARPSFAPGAGQLRRSFERIAEDLRHQYLLAYPSDDKKHDGKWREIKVVVDRPGVTLTNRKGYFAPSDLPAGRGAAHR